MTNKIQFIEIDLKKCQLTYGSAPCAAAIGVTGEAKCFNSRATCQDLDNIDIDTAVARYSIANTDQRFDLEATPNITIPSISSIEYTPAELKLGESLGVRASLSIKFKDHRSPDTDASGDDYIISRTYNPFEQGTYWGKFRARHPFIRGQSLRWIQGEVNQNIADMETRHFVVESTAGPDANGNFTVVAKDILKLADGDRSTAPLAVDAETGAAITDVYTGNVSIGTGNALLMPVDGFAVLGGAEIVQYERFVSDPTNSTITILARGQYNTVAVAHEEASLVQYCVDYTGEDPADILYDLLTTYANVDASFIPLTDWQTESADYINRTYTTLIPQPVAVNMLVNELLQQTGSTMWWDNTAQQIRWQVLRQPAADATVFDDSTIVRGTLNISDNYQRRVSRAWVFFGQINPLLNLNDERNYSTRVVRRSASSELDFNGVPAIKQIFSRWIPSAGRDTAERLGDLILQRFSTPPRLSGFRLLRDSGITEPELGGAYNVANQFIQNPDGSTETVPIQITSVSPSVGAFTVRAEEITFDAIVAPVDPNIVPVSIDVNQNNVNLRTLYDQIAPAPTALTVVNCTVNTGTIVGSTSAALPAFTTGSWPAGVTLNLINKGRIVGLGGAGGDGASFTTVRLALSPIFSVIDATDGEDGGVAIETTFDINIDNTDGIIGGGGGGGGGSVAAYGYLTNTSPGAAYIRYWGYSTGGGGGGGAGNLTGAGGDSGSLSPPVVVSTQKEPIYTPPPQALAGSLETGSEGTNGFSQNYVDVVNLNYQLAGAKAGSGGDLGQDGDDGSITATSNPVAGIYSGYTVNGPFEEGSVGLGGTAGNAITQNGGTVTLTVAGDIRGAIV